MFALGSVFGQIRLNKLQSKRTRYRSAKNNTQPRKKFRRQKRQQVCFTSKVMSSCAGCRWNNESNKITNEWMFCLDKPGSHATTTEKPSNFMIQDQSHAFTLKQCRGVDWEGVATHFCSQKFIFLLRRKSHKSLQIFHPPQPPPPWKPHNPQHNVDFKLKLIEIQKPC